MSLGRNDTQAAMSHSQPLLDHQQDYVQQPYHDSPSRDLISPPPQYASPAPPEPPSPTHSREHQPSFRHNHSHSQDRVSREIQRRPIASTYHDELPPPPPPHRDGPAVVAQEDYSQGSSLSSHMEQPIKNTGGGAVYITPHTGDGYQRNNSTEPSRSIPGGAPTPSFHSYDHNPSRTSSPYNQPRFSRLPDRSSYGSGLPLAAGAATPGSATPGTGSDPRLSRYSSNSIPLEEFPPSTGAMMNYSNYHDSPYHSSHQFNNAVSGADINPNDILDDGDDGFMPEPQRKSMLAAAKRRSVEPTGPVGATTGGFGNIPGRNGKDQASSTMYDPGNVSADGSGNDAAEKSEWLSRQKKGKSKMRWIVGVVIGLVIIIAIVAGIVGGVLGSHNSGSGSSNSDTNNAASDTAANGDLGANSAEIQALMNNKNLHKVFPGIDYTPWGTQYPLCLTYPPSQNNVTRDMAVLSQLTNAVRLYGTDCNQTEMVLHAIDRLELKDMKVWLGVWIDTNQTTTERQLSQMYTILENTKDLSIFKGAIVGNEALYRAGEDKSQSEQELITILKDVKSQFTSKGYDLPVATSDLGDNWNGQLVDVVDMVMSNIHPFFAGVTADAAAGWTWNFWQTHDVVLTSAQPSIKQIISETGWPSSGGKDCGGLTGKCNTGQSGAIASVDNMNTFMNDWVCQALANGTEYFWFEAFDEPWKIVYNQGDQNWEDQWGLMDPARNLKDGLIIPSCGGKTVS